MKILWLVNIVLPEFAEVLGREKTNYGGWLIGAKRALIEEQTELIICTPMDDPKKVGKYQVNQATYYAFDKRNFSGMQEAFKKILQEENPDVIHIYGTEFEPCWALASVADPKKMVVTIQGALTYYKNAVYGGIPEKLCKDTIWHKLFRRITDGGYSMELQMKSFLDRLHYEEKTLQRTHYINGGSDWGDAVAKAVNPKCETLSCNLILRDSFYEAPYWNYDECEKHSIFILYSYPIKGFHKFLEALALIVKHYPDTKVYVVGRGFIYTKHGKLRDWISRRTLTYSDYVQALIEKYHLESHICFLNNLPEAKIKERLLKSNVFVSAAAIENQSTMLGEAMITGVPSVASYVGAIREQITHGESGFMYPFDAPYMLAHDILKIFKDPELAKKFSENGHKRASEYYNREKNTKDLIQMYKTIIDNQNKGE